jgi:hypothetical protein
MVDPNDFDAVNVLLSVVATLRAHAIQAGTDAAATLAPPAGWHGLVITARPSGHVVLGSRFAELSPSRHHNVSSALARQGWDADEDGDGATRRFPPGTPPADAAFAALSALTVAGAPNRPRPLRAVDGRGAPVDLA